MGLVASAEQSRVARGPRTKWVVGAISALSEERDEIDAGRTRETFASASRDMSVSGGRSNEEGGEMRHSAPDSEMVPVPWGLTYSFPRPQCVPALQGIYQGDHL